jgi:hypothetical protein
MLKVPEAFCLPRSWLKVGELFEVVKGRTVDLTVLVWVFKVLAEGEAVTVAVGVLMMELVKGKLAIVLPV